MAARKKPKADKKPTLVGERKLGRVLITGASAGIGAELAREFAKHGHSLVLVARSKDKLTALAGELNAAHDTEALVIVEDLSRKGCAQAIVDELADRGIEIDILVNNAGVLDVGPFADTATDVYDNMVALNVAAPTSLMSLLLPAMVARKFGRILNVASLAAFQPLPSMAVYAATKAYVPFGMPHDRLGEEVAAAVVLNEGASCDERELKEFASKQLADFKLPKTIVILADIPKGATGKVQRIGLAEKLGLVKAKA